jgi:hypothetical protein
MTTPPAPSARPPNSRRFEALDSPAAKAFVQGADSGAGEPAGAAPPAEPPHLAVVEPAVPPPVEPPKVPAPPAPEVPAVPRGPRKERMQPVTLRVSEALHAQLLYIADNGKRSMNQFIVDVLGPAVQAEIEKIRKRKTLGLD